MLLYKRLILVLMLLFGICSIAEARPKVGLVLGGGGAAGVAHVGVLKVLEENNIPIDYIAGTSMGAIVGGLYASGKSADELEEIVNSLDWLALFADDQSRVDKNFYLKRQDSGFFRNLELGLKDKKLKAPTGLVTGQKLMFELRKLFSPVAHIQNFDQLPIPFRAVATNIESGNAVVLSKGNLAQSIRASMAIPGAFSPVRIGNKLLVDGFVANNVPVDVVKAMGADILIVVNIPTFLEKQQDLDSALSISFQAMQLMMLKTTEPQLALMGKQDILIEPGTKDISSLAFDRVAETIPLGVEAATLQLAKLKKIAVPVLARRQQQHKNEANTPEGKRIARVIINNNSVLKDSILKRRLGIKAGESFDPTRLQHGLENIHGLGYFELVDYVTERDAKGDYILTINAHKNTNGNQRLRFGFSLGDDLDGDTSYQFGVKHTWQGLNDRGAEWNNSMIIGDTIRFESELYQPVPEQDAFIKPRFWHEQRDFFAYQGEERVAEVRGRSVGVQVDAGKELGNWGEMHAGMFYEYAEPDVKTGQVDNGILNNRVKSVGVELAYEVDTMDDDLLPKQGSRFSAEYRHGFKELGSDETFDRLLIRAGRAWEEDKHRFIISGEIGTVFQKDMPLTEQLSLGGLGRLSGLYEDQLTGRHMLVGTVAYMYELFESPGIAQFFVGGSLEAGNVWNDRKDIEADDLLLSASIFLGADTALGPAFVGLAQTEGYEVQPFLYVGQSF